MRFQVAWSYDREEEVPSLPPTTVEISEDAFVASFGISLVEATGLATMDDYVSEWLSDTYGFLVEDWQVI